MDYTRARLLAMHSFHFFNKAKQKAGLECHAAGGGAMQAFKLPAGNSTRLDGSLLSCQSY